MYVKTCGMSAGTQILERSEPRVVKIVHNVNEIRVHRSMLVYVVWRPCVVPIFSQLGPHQMVNHIDPD